MDMWSGQKKILTHKYSYIFYLSIIPFIICAITFSKIFMDDIALYYSGVGYEVQSKIMRGQESIDPNVGFISLALTWQGVCQLFTGHLPLWNYYEGFGQPLLGEMQAAPFFPPSWFVLLPHGIFLEHAFLQWWAGIGAYLFFRKFGLSHRAAITGAIMWEANGVFAWLQNTVFNPVAFLPWLLYLVESLFASIKNNSTWRERLTLLCGGILMGAITLYSGFPEVVYLYCLFVFIWSVYRVLSLSGRGQRLSYTGGLGIIAVGTLILAAPLLTAFFEFLGQAYIGRHAATNGAVDNYANLSLPAAAMARYLFPYAFGGIFSIDDTDWNDIGGYIGLVPFIVALASMFVPGRRTVKMILMGWVVFAVGTSHGMPVIHTIAVHIPGVGYAESCRFLNSGWIFCIFFACALFIDQLPSLAPRLVSRALVLAISLGSGIGLFLLFLKRHAFILVWSNSSRWLALAALVLSIIGVMCVFVASRLSWRRCQLVLMMLLVAEGTTWYFVPFLSLPREGKMDQPLISFLQKNIGFNRMVNGSARAMNPNFGSYFNIATLNFNDLPTPLRTVDYIHTHLDPFADGTVYIPEYPTALPKSQKEERHRLFVKNLSAFGEAGVKYVLVNNFGEYGERFTSAENVDHNSPLLLGAGQSFLLSVPTQLFNWSPQLDETRYLEQIELKRDNNHAKLDGDLIITVCAESICSEGTKNLSTVGYKKILHITLNHALRLSAQRPVVVTVKKLGGVHDLSVSVGSKTDKGIMFSGDRQNIPANSMPLLGFVSTFSRTLPLPISYQDEYFTVYEIPEVKKYFYSNTCDVHFDTWERADVSCANPGMLNRLELFYPGWQATVDGVATPIEAKDRAFQTINLPAGQHHVVFSYKPAWLIPAFLVSGSACFLLVIGFFVFYFGNRRRK